MKLSAETIFRNDRGRVAALVPAAVRDHLGAKEGDALIFETGCLHNAERAALEGYVIVKLKRAAPVQISIDVSEPESLIVAVERKRKERDHLS